MSRVELDPERGRAVAARLRALGVKGILIKAAEQGYITQLTCKMPECFCPEELGGYQLGSPKRLRPAEVVPRRPRCSSSVSAWSITDRVPRILMWRRLKMPITTRRSGWGELLRP
jgi:hypothetical protein